MSFADDVYSLHKDELDNHKEDAVGVTLSILEKQTRSDIMQLVDQMDDEEVVQMISVYLVETIKERMVQEGKFPGLKSSLSLSSTH